MFSGLIESMGSVTALRRHGRGAVIEVACTLGGEPLALGESIAVAGVCLTVTAVTAAGFAADVSPETLARTTLARALAEVKVNVERSLRLGDRLGGHLVLGHVDATGQVVAVRPTGAFTTARFSFPAALAPELAEKGSVAVDGVSLTISALGDGWFEAALIPATLAATTLGVRRPGDAVNIETDVIAKYVRRSLAGGRGSLAELLGGAVDAED